MKDPEKRAYFMESCSKLVLNPETNSTFDWLEADDRATFRVPTRITQPSQ